MFCTITEILNDVDMELRRANAKFGPFNTAHEGYAVILEELDELWDDIKTNNSVLSQRKEAIQVAAMAIKYIQYLDRTLAAPPSTLEKG